MNTINTTTANKNTNTINDSRRYRFPSIDTLVNAVLIGAFALTCAVIVATQGVQSVFA